MRFEQGVPNRSGYKAYIKRLSFSPDFSSKKSPSWKKIRFWKAEGMISFTGKDLVF